jgi:hypothetical protein
MAVNDVAPVAGKGRISWEDCACELEAKRRSSPQASMFETSKVTVGADGGATTSGLVLVTYARSGAFAISSKRLTIWIGTGVCPGPQSGIDVVVASSSRKYEPTGTPETAKLWSAPSERGNFV